MNVEGLIEIFMGHVGLGLMAALIFGVGCFIFIRFQKRKGNWRLTQLAATGALVFCLIIIFGAVFFIRGTSEHRDFLWMPFAEYREAWHHFTAVNWRNLILNILMFVPVGFLLPLVSERFKRRKWAFAAVFSLTIFIELIQFIFGLGLAATDDAINNALGGMIGHGLVMSLITLKKREAKIAGHLLPLGITLLAFALIFGTYELQEFGNSPLNHYDRLNMEQAKITGTTALETERPLVGIYQMERFSRQELDDFAEAFLNQIGDPLRDSMRLFVYDTLIIYHTQLGNQLQVNFEGKAFRYLNWSDGEHFTLDGEEISEALGFLLQELPPYEKILELGDGKYAFYFDHRDGAVWTVGALNVQTDEASVIRLIQNHVKALNLVGEREALSQQEALKRIQQGRFMAPRHHGDIRTLEIRGVSLQRTVDSKGFYRPVHVFETLLNGEEWNIQILAY